ncbi:MAG: ATPase, T2SS/T4P/T4SS family [Planctomycetota bacterium]
MARKRLKLGELLRQWGIIDDQQTHEALKIAKGSGKRVGETLIDLGYVSDNDIAKALASQTGMEFVDLDMANVIDKKNLDLIPKDLIRKYQILPLGESGNKLKVLVHDPMDLALIDDLRFRLSRDIELALAAKSKIKDYIDTIFSETQASIDQLTQDLSIDMSIDASIDTDKSIDVDAEPEDAEDGTAAPIIKLVNQIISEAVHRRASDIHIEPFEDRVRLRYRIDGVCVELDRVPKRTQGSVIARLKIISGVRVEEKRVPQDGRIKMKIGGKIIDFRVSFCPAYHGESVVLRILRPEAAKLGLRNLGMQEDTLEGFNDIIRRPNGIFLVTGPTGSGKTTSLYSALNELNTPDTKIITAEDPVEYNFKGINQCQVNMNIDPPLSFSRILRAMLRQAPNIILVGEIRDKEVGEVAVQAALTGHMVFSTLHTNDAPSAITRLTDMGLKPFLVASSIQAVLAQRLVRVLCDECKQVDEEPNPRLMQLCGLTPDMLEGHTLYKPGGCQVCSGTGYRGRRGVYELMVMNAEIRELAFNRATVSDLRKAAKNSGMRDLLGDGVRKVLAGQTTLREISKIAQVEGTVGEEDDLEDGLAA